MFLSVLIPCHFRTSQPPPTVTPRACITCPFLPSASPLLSLCAHEHGSTSSTTTCCWLDPPSLCPMQAKLGHLFHTRPAREPGQRRGQDAQAGRPRTSSGLATASLTAVLPGFELQRELGTLQDSCSSVSVSCGKMPACKLMCPQCVPEPRLDTWIQPHIRGFLVPSFLSLPFFCIPFSCLISHFPSAKLFFFTH